MVSIKRVESFIKRAIWHLTRSSDIIKYVPKSIKNGVIIGDCAVIVNKQDTFDVFSKSRQPIRRDIANRKVAICVATLMNQYNSTHRDTLDELLQLDKQYSIANSEYIRNKNKNTPNNDVHEYLFDKLMITKQKIDKLYISMTL